MSLTTTMITVKNDGVTRFRKGKIWKDLLISS
jgi:hypothetical protein